MTQPIRAAQDVESSAGTMQAAVIADSEAAKAFIVGEGCRLCAAAAGHRARAIALTGSMSRGEATLKKDGQSWRALGDATFLIVFDGPVRTRMAELEQEIQRSLAARGIRCKIVVVTSTTRQLRTMKPHIYAYELRERGMILWGDKDALRLIPQFTAAEIPREDGWWFLCNRMIEQLESAAEASSLHDNDTAVRYRIAKLYLAMAACYLLAIGQYAPSYRERAARLEKLARCKHAPAAPIPLSRFSRFVSQSTDLKLQGEAMEATGDFPQWADTVRDAEALWRWVLARISGAGPSLDRKDVFAALVARQTILERAKGWVHAAYAQPSVFSHHWLRWARLACSTSPRYLVYGAASELFFTAPERDAIRPEELARVVARLPLPSLASPEPGQPLAWRAAANLVAHNFHLLLESNRC